MFLLVNILNKGDQAVAVGKYEKALRFYEQAAKQFPQDSRAHYGMAYALDAMGVGDLALQKYRDALSREPCNREYHIRCVCCLIDQGRINEALEAWQVALDLLRDPELSFDPTLYSELHAEVALHFLQSQEVGAAREVLMNVPLEVSRGDVRFNLLFKTYAELDLINKELEFSIYTDRKLQAAQQLPVGQLDPARYID